MPLFVNFVFHLFLNMEPGLKDSLCNQWDSFRGSICLCVWDRADDILETASELNMWACLHFPFQHWYPICPRMVHVLCMLLHVNSFVPLYRSPCFLRVLYLLWLVEFFFFLFCSITWALNRFYVYNLLHDISLMMAEWDIDLWIQNVLWSHFIATLL